MIVKKPRLTGTFLKGQIQKIIRKYASSQKGFTLMEMVVSVFVMSVMAGVLMPHLLGAGDRAEKAACEANQRTIRAALSEYYLLYHSYPSGDSAGQLQTLVGEKLLDSVPKDPSGGEYVITDTDVNNVQVTCTVDGPLGTNP